MPCKSARRVRSPQEDRDCIPLTLARLAQFPLVTYEPGFTGRGHIDEAFEQARLPFDVVLSAMGADVIKTYVELGLGLGVGIIASIACEPARDTRLRAIDARHLFALNMTRVAVRRGTYLRDFGDDFTQTLASTLTREVVDAALSSPSSPAGAAEAP